MEFKPYSEAFAADPYRVYAALRETRPIFYDPDSDVTFLTTHRDISAVLTDDRFGRSLGPDALPAHLRGKTWGALPNYQRYICHNLLETEGKDHARVRRLLVRAFSRARVGEHRGVIEQALDARLDALLPQGRMDFAADLMGPLTVEVIATVLGLPQEDHHRLQPWSTAILRLYERDAHAGHAQQAEVATTQFADYLGELLGQRRRQPEEDLLSALVQAQDDGGRLRDDEVLATAMLLLNAGHESTVNAAANGLLALLRHPDQLQQLRGDPELMPAAIEEMFRYDPPLQYFHRYALEDLEFQGHALRRGATVGLLFGSANRDPRIFEAPDCFEIGRESGRHLAFGKGRHFCLGAQLARLEMEVVFQALLHRLPSLQVLETPPQFHPGLVFRALKSLTLHW